MNVFLDGKVVNMDGWSIRTVGELVRQLGNLPEFSNRVVETIEVDGLEVGDWERDSAVFLPDGATVHVKTQTVGDLLACAMQSAKEYLPRLGDGAVQAATLLQEGRSQQAFGLISLLIEGLHWYSEFLANLATLVPQEQQRVSVRLGELNAAMALVLDAWERQDQTLLADLLEYELSPELHRSLQYVEALSQSDIRDVRNAR